MSLAVRLPQMMMHSRPFSYESDRRNFNVMFCSFLFMMEILHMYVKGASRRTSAAG